MIIVRSSRWPNRDNRKRFFISKYEFRIKILRSLSSYALWSKRIRYSFARRRSKFQRFQSISCCRSKCFIRIAGRSTYRFSKMSRYATKYYASWGYITGIRRSSF